MTNLRYLTAGPGWPDSKRPCIDFKAPVIWSRVPEITLSPRQLCRAFICENVVSVGRVKVDPARLFITLWIIKCTDIPLSLSSLGHLITVGFVELIFTSLIRVSALNPKFRHYVTLVKPRVAPVRRAKAFIWRKVVPPARVALSAETHPSCLSLFLCKRLFDFEKN